MTDDERLLADLATKVRKLTDQVAFRDMLLTQIKDDLKQERAATVAYLQDMADAAGDHNDFWTGAGSGIGYAAQCIERGLHRTEDYPLGFNVWEREK